MEVLIHELVQAFNLGAIQTNQNRCKIMLNQSVNGSSSATTGVGVSGALGTIIKGDGCRDQFEMGVFAVHGIDKWLI